MGIKVILLVHSCLLLFALPCHAGDFLQRIASVRSLPSAILKDSIPAASRRRRKRRSIRSTLLASAVKAPESSPTRPKKLLRSVKTTLGPPLEASVRAIGPQLKRSGFYYGLSQDVVAYDDKKPKKPGLDALMHDALSELKGVRSEMESLRRELKTMKRQLGHDDDDEEEEDTVSLSPTVMARGSTKNWDKVGREVEQWAEKILFEEGNSEEDGWKEVKCSKLCPSYNKHGNIKAYMKWMKDSRGSQAKADDEGEYPCIKVFATLDAPMETVCEYLADEGSLPEYNSLVEKHKDIQDISPHSKVCWGQSPKILFVMPREFITFCHHRWLRDGTQVVVNQACNHEDYPKESEKKALKAFALRGANFISKHPEDPDNKTRYCLVCHANPGSDISPWMTRLAVNNLAPIEPFKLFYKINKQVKKIVKENPQQTELVSSAVVSGGRSGRPGGLSQMGYACYWPKGGGLKEGMIHGKDSEQVDPAASTGESKGEQATKPKPEDDEVNPLKE